MGKGTGVLVVALTLVAAGVVAFIVIPEPVGAGLRTPTATIDLQQTIYDIEVDPVRPFVYLSGYQRVVVVSLDTRTIVREILLANLSTGMDLDPVTDRLYVALAGSEGISVVDLASQAPIANWPVGGPVADVAVGRPGRLYVTLGGTGWSAGKILNTTTGTVIGEFGTGFYAGARVEASPDFGSLYVGETGMSPLTLTKLDVRTDSPTVVATGRPGQILEDMALAPDGSALYVAARSPDGIMEVDPETLTSRSNMTIGSWPSAVAVSPDGSVVFGGKISFSEPKLFSFDATTRAPVDVLAATQDVHRLALDSTGRYLVAFTSNNGPPLLLELFDLSLPADQPPVVAFSSTPDPGHVGEPVVFTAEGSYDREGIFLYRWEFGDGEVAESYTDTFITHIYGSVGSYTVTLTLTDTANQRNSTTRTVTITEPPVDLEMFSHPAGFRLPVPRGWERQQNVSFRGTVTELVLRGPERNGFRTNILVDTDRDSTVRESDSYLRTLVDQAIAEIRKDRPDVTMIEGPEFRRMSGHAGVVFTLSYPSERVVQRMAVVVSDVHDRYWILLLSADADYFPHIDPTFEAMLDGFEITLAPPFLGIPAEALIGLFVAGVVAIMLVVFVLRRRKAPPPPVFPTFTGPPAAGSACSRCGAYSPPSDRFCTRCGNALLPVATGPRFPAPPPPPP